MEKMPLASPLTILQKMPQNSHQPSKQFPESPQPPFPSPRPLPSHQPMFSTLKSRRKRAEGADASNSGSSGPLTNQTSAGKHQVPKINRNPASFWSSLLVELPTILVGFVIIYIAYAQFMKYNYPEDGLLGNDTLISQKSEEKVAKMDEIVPKSDKFDTFEKMVSTDFHSFILQEKTQVSSDSALYTFQLASEDTLGMTVTGTVAARAVVDGDDVIRAYNPISQPSGSFTILVKTYPDSKMGTIFSSLKTGDLMDFKGPFAKYKYVPNESNRITFIAGGTGITPHYQLIKQILEDENDKTHLKLIYASKSPSDILLKPQLDELMASHPEQLEITYVVDRGDEEWSGETGFISANLITKIHGLPGDKTARIFVCGPPGMMSAICGKKGPQGAQGLLDDSILARLGFDQTEVWKF